MHISDIIKGCTLFLFPNQKCENGQSIKSVRLAKMKDSENYLQFIFKYATSRLREKDINNFHIKSLHHKSLCGFVRTFFEDIHL